VNGSIIKRESTTIPNRAIYLHTIQPRRETTAIPTKIYAIASTTIESLVFTAKQAKDPTVQIPKPGIIIVRVYKNYHSTSLARRITNGTNPEAPHNHSACLQELSLHKFNQKNNRKGNNECKDNKT